jgi:type IV pilus assembly protein PilE
MLMLKHRNSRRGFTLIELVIAILVIGILSAIAYPNYTQSVRKSRRSDAISAILSIQQAVEKYRANNLTYASSLAAAPTTTTALTQTAYTMTVSTSAATYYTFVVDSGANGVAATSTAYRIKATAIAGTTQASDTIPVDCTVLTINEAGTKTPASCWAQ